MSITYFRGSHRFLSNFYMSAVVYEGQIYPSVENAYQAAKAHLALREKYKDCSPGQAKRMGQKEVLPSQWEESKLYVMRSLLARKFAAGNYLSTLLLKTGEEDLVEGNSWNDTYWGVCNGVGENNLGKLLMERRAFLILDLVE